MSVYTPITVEVLVNAAPEAAWKAFTDPAAIVRWNFAHPSWHCPTAENDLQVGGKFSYRMAARDGSFAFDYAGIYSALEAPRVLEFTLGDLIGEGRQVKVEFRPEAGGTRVVETFDAENQNSLDQQRQGWQAILDNFRAVAEGRA